MKIIDFRVRPPYKTIKESYLFDNDNYAQTFGGHWQQSAAQKSMELLIQEMDQWNVTKGIAPTRKLYNNDNHDLIDLLAEYPDRFIGVPNIDPLDGQAALDEIDELVVNGPCSAIILESGIAGMGIGAATGAECLTDHDKRIYPIYEKCQAENIPILFTCSCLAYPACDVNIPNHIDQVAADFPNLKMVISHGGWPWAQATCGIAVKRPNVWLSPDIYMINAPGFRDYFDAANYMLQDRFLFGSAYPGMSMKICIDFCMERIRSEVQDRFFYQNAAKLFGIE